MTTLVNLRARKQQLLDRLQDEPGPNERAEIERLLAQIDAALDLLDRAKSLTRRSRTKPK
jgi:uncharacterized protein YpiB (UPF0302 family)